MHICDSQVFHMHFGWVHVLFRCSGDNISFCYQQTQHFRRWGENPLGWAGMGFVCMLPFCFYIVSVHAQLWLNMILKRVTMILVLPRLTHPPQPTHTHTHAHTQGCMHTRETHTYACLQTLRTLFLWAAVVRWCSLFPPCLSLSLLFGVWVHDSCCFVSPSVDVW